MCNSLVWACSLTGKINLTYEEALDSENQARKLLGGFPRPVTHFLLVARKIIPGFSLNYQHNDVLQMALISMILSNLRHYL